MRCRRTTGRRSSISCARSDSSSEAGRVEIRMIRRCVLDSLTAEERRLVGQWTRGILAFYASLALIVVTLASVTRQTGDANMDMAKAERLRTIHIDSPR